jgi:acyl-CoA synthetase (AMP-forming)/AMP-acid ligase II
MIFHSPYPAIDVPCTTITTHALRHSERLRIKPALIEPATNRSITFGELPERIEQRARELKRTGVRPGDVVTFFACNSIEYVIMFHAVATLGAIFAPVNPTFRIEELARQLRQHRSKFIVTTEDLIGTVDEAIVRSPVRAILLLGDPEPYRRLGAEAPANRHVPQYTSASCNDVVTILCSSGTTGLPKGVMLTHRNLVAISAQLDAMGDMTEADTFPGHLPFFHIFGTCTTLTTSLANGLTSIVMPRFDFERFLQIIQDYRITRTFATPPILVQLAKNPIVDRFDLSSLKVIACGAAPLGSEVERQVTDRIGCQVKQLYGMTELAPSHMMPDDAPAEKQGSVGVCTPNTRCKVMDPQTGAELGPNETGELWTAGPQAMKGYFDNPEATAATLDADGWIHTGDIGFADPDGYFYIVDRLKELIKYKAYQVAPAELEALLLSHPAVADCAVVRYPDEDAGEIPKAFIVARAPIDPGDLMGWVAERVAPYKKIRMVEFIDVIPKSPSGKILRRELIERDRQAAAAVS